MRDQITPAWINFRVPVNVSLDYLNEEYFSCEEPPGTSLWPELATAAPLTLAAALAWAMAKGRLAVGGPQRPSSSRTR